MGKLKELLNLSIGQTAGLSSAIGRSQKSQQLARVPGEPQPEPTADSDLDSDDERERERRKARKVRRKEREQRKKSQQEDQIRSRSGRPRSPVPYTIQSLSTHRCPLLPLPSSLSLFLLPSPLCFAGRL